MRKARSQQAEISVGNLEVVSEENFLKRLKGISSCQDCKQRRIKCGTTSSSNNNNNHIATNSPKRPTKNKKKFIHPPKQRSNLPIVIKLSDSLRPHRPQRQKPWDYSDYNSGYYRKPRYQDKNFNAMIQYIEKTHYKPVDLNLGVNLNRCCVDSTVPNNYCCADCTLQYRPFPGPALDMICNDLSGKLHEEESQTSSSDSHDEEYVVDPDLTTDEIEHLASFTTGFSVTCFNNDRCGCPHCRQRKKQNDSDGEQHASSTDSASSPSSDTDDSDTTDPKSHTHKPAKPAVYKDSTSSQIFTITSKPATGEQTQDSVYIDLTGTDVQISVYYYNKPAARDRHWCYTNNNNSTTHSSNTPHVTSSGASSTSTSSSSSVSGTSTSTTTSQSSTSASFLYQVPAPCTMGGFWYYPPVPFLYYPAPAGSLVMPPMSPRCTAPIVSIPRPLCVPRNKDILLSTKTCMIPAHEIDKFTTTQPAQRPWLELTHPSRDKSAAVFTVMCYNVLCDKYCTRQQYGYCPTWALSWEYRKKGIIDEIRHCSADIISLQEVETDQFHNFFLPELKQEGYEGVFAAKSRARTMSEVERKHVDGCAIFYRSSKFSLVKKHLMEFNQLAMASAEGSHDMLNRVMTKDNIGLAALLETKEGVYENGMLPADGQVRQPLLVATAHVHWDPEFSDVKLIQTMMLMSDLKSFIEETQTSLRPGGVQPKHTDVNSLPLILCADLNSLPESGVIEYLVEGKIAANHGDFKNLSYEECMQKMGSSGEYLCHDFRLNRSYDSDIMPYTNYTYDFKGVIDYIFYSRDYLTTLGILGPIDPEWFASNKVIGCPHPHIPSDHLSLLTQFEMAVPLKKTDSSAPQQSSFPSSRR